MQVPNASPYYKSLFVVLWCGRTHRSCGRWLWLGVTEIRHPELRGAGFHLGRLLSEHLLKTTPTCVCFSQAECRYCALRIMLSAQQPSCWIQQITAHFSQFWHGLTHLATGTQKSSVLGVWKTSPTDFCTIRGGNAWLKSQAKFGPMLIQDKKIISA